MDDHNRTDPIERALAEPVRAAADESPYGAWRALADTDAVSLALGFPFPDSFPNDELVACAERVFEAEGDRALQYGGGEHVNELTDAIARRAGERGIDCSSEEVLVTNGSNHAIDLICSALLEPGDDLFVEAPTFMGALTLFRTQGAAVTAVPIDGDGLDVDALERELAARHDCGGSSPKLCYTIPTFQNPTGTTLPLERRRRLLDLAETYDFLVLEDDAYGELRYDGADVPTLAELDDSGRVIHVGTFSKTIAPGVRTGWVIASERAIGAFRQVQGGGTNVFTQGVLGRYCADGYLEANVETLRDAYAERRDRLLEALEAHLPPDSTWTTPDGGFFVWVELPEGVDADALLPRANEAGVVYLPGSMFYPDEGGERCLRLSFSHASLEGLDRGAEALGRVVRETLDER